MTPPITFALTLMLGLPAQDPTPAQPPAESEANTSQSAEALRGRIHDMRMNLLLGGDRVRAAEDEAVGFYKDKSELVEQRIDSVNVELAEKNATYDILLERALTGPSDTRSVALSDASSMRVSINQLKSEAKDLEGRRSEIDSLVQSVRSRDRERERLAAQINTTGSDTASLGAGFARIGLAPVVEPGPAASPLEDDELVLDLLERDPAGARRLLYGTDPQGYWQRFPLRPPVAPLRSAFRFPPADLPGRR